MKTGQVCSKKYWATANYVAGEMFYQVFGVGGYMSGKFDTVDEAKAHALYKETGQMQPGWM